MKPIVLRFDRLESRTAPAVITWDGGGGDSNWTTPANWVGDFAPQPGDDLVFPRTASRLFPVNDFPVGTTFGQLQVLRRGYELSGNAVRLSGGVSAEMDNPPGNSFNDSRINFPITLAADQTFARPDHASNIFYFNGPVDLNGHTLTAAPGGPIAFEAPITGNGGLVVADGSGSVTLYAVNTFTGPTTVIGSDNVFGLVQFPTLVVLGSVGRVSVDRAVLRGTGTTGPLTVTSGLVDPGFSENGTLTVGDLDLTNARALTIVRGSGGDDQLVVHGTVRLGGALAFSLTPFVSPGYGGSIAIIDNDGTDPIVATFADLPEGAIVTNAPVVLRVTYHGGDGNDVALVADQAPLTAVGAGAGGLPIVNVYNADGRLRRSFLAYDAAFRGGVHVAVADVNDDGVSDVVTAPGPGGGPHVKIFDGATGGLIRQWMAYDPAFRGGVFVASTPIDPGDFVPDVITGAGPGGGPHVQAFNGVTGDPYSSFMAYDPAFTGGVSVAGISRGTEFSAVLGPVVNPTPGRVVTGAGPGGGPHVRVFAMPGGVVIDNLFPFASDFRGGVNVAAVYADNSSRTAYVLAAAGPGGPPAVWVYRFFDNRLVGNFSVYDAGFGGGVTVAVVGGEVLRFVTGPGPGGGPHVRQWLARYNFQFDGFDNPVLEREFFAFDPAFRGGVFVG